MNSLWKLIVVASLLAGATVVFAPDRSFACSCAEPLSVQQSVEGASIVFAGEVADVREARNKYPYYRNIVEFKTDKVFKGEALAQVSLWTGGGGGDCGFHFVKGESYLVYAYGSVEDGLEDTTLNTGICTRTALLTQAGGDLAELGDGAPPNRLSSKHIAYWEEEQPGQAAADHSFTGSLTVTVVAISAILAAGIVIWGIKRKRAAGRR